MATVLLTRPRLRSTGTDVLQRTLAAAGATVVELPMISFHTPPELTELDQALSRAARGTFAAIILSSPTAVQFMEARLTELSLLDLMRITGRFAAVGEATARALSELGLTVAYPIPPRGGSAQLATLLSGYALTARPVLLLQSQLGLGVLEDSLSAIGALAERVTLYHTAGPSVGDVARLMLALESRTPPNVITFFSPSAVHNFVRVLAETDSRLLRSLPALACIGETTAKAVEETLHRRPEIVARKADQQSLAEDILEYLGPAVQGESNR